MPIYEFVCQSCGNEFEKIQSFSDSTVPTCTRCGSNQVVRRMGKPAIHFKGNGWYVTDSKKSSDKNGSSKGSAESSKSESTSESKSEGATEAKSEKSESKSSSESKSESTAKSTAPVASD